MVAGLSPYPPNQGAKMTALIALLLCTAACTAAELYLSKRPAMLVAFLCGGITIGIGIGTGAGYFN